MRMRLWVIAFMVLGCPGPALSQADHSRLVDYFQANYRQVRTIYSSRWTYSADFPGILDAAHGDVVRALRAGNDRAFRAALMRFLDVSRAPTLRRADIANATTYGSGGGGSSNTFSSGWNTGIALGTAYGRRHADRNPVTCMYLYRERPLSVREAYRLSQEGRRSFWSGSPFWHCDTPRLDLLRTRLRNGSMSPSSFRRFLDGA